MRTACIFLFATVSGCSVNTGYSPRNGDIVFHESQSAQSRAIQLATGSRYSHMGLVVMRAGDPYVFEAVQPVQLTPLRDWTARGRDGHFVAKRLRDAETLLRPQVLSSMEEVGLTFTGKDYDLYFEWSDERIYCSELVWKIFERGAGIEIGELSVLGDFDLSHPDVKARVAERYGENIPLDETVISPSAMFEASILETVFSN